MESNPINLGIETTIHGAENVLTRKKKKKKGRGKFVKNVDYEINDARIISYVSYLH